MECIGHKYKPDFTVKPHLCCWCWVTWLSTILLTFCLKRAIEHYVWEKDIIKHIWLAIRLFWGFYSVCKKKKEQPQKFLEDNASNNTDQTSINLLFDKMSKTAELNDIALNIWKYETWLWHWPWNKSDYENKITYHIMAFYSFTFSEPSSVSTLRIVSVQVNIFGLNFMWKIAWIYYRTGIHHALLLI